MIVASMCSSCQSCSQSGRLSQNRSEKIVVTERRGIDMSPNGQWLFKAKRLSTQTVYFVFLNAPYSVGDTVMYKFTEE